MKNNISQKEIVKVYSKYNTDLCCIAFKAKVNKKIFIQYHLSLFTALREKLMYNRFDKECLIIHHKNHFDFSQQNNNEYCRVQQNQLSFMLCDTV